ncbi:hypothetical protein BDY21DRAFT_370092 [Lineolata rhizophorae]|uniref:Mediator of RNA polymerase II transcription subunit 9 n=1 Tax=Lineolata rhizophorae TaxID=578093 RepID=A0A6A6P6C6_9PEZI|nr:hypothetical protein BDY21DRAFT_370092 [Lineolata rhizophorae]
MTTTPTPHHPTSSARNTPSFSLPAPGTAHQHPSFQSGSTEVATSYHSSQQHQHQQHQQQPQADTASTSTMPPPSTFDVLPPLHSLLSRLLFPPPGAEPAADTKAPPAPSAANKTSPLTGAGAGATAASSAAATATSTATATATATAAAAASAIAQGGSAGARGELEGGALEIQQLGTAAAAVRLRLARARAAVRGLPDVERSVGEQEEERRDLEGRIGRLVGVLEGLRERGGGGGDVGSGEDGAG